MLKQLNNYNVTFRSLSSENVSTIIPKIMFRPIVVMKMKNDTWYRTTNPNFWKVASDGWAFITCTVNVEN